MSSASNVINISEAGNSATSSVIENSRLWQYISSLQGAESINDIKDVCQIAFEQIGIQFFKYSRHDQSNLTNNEFSFYTCPTIWLSRYSLEGYSDIDPRLRHCKQKITPMLWTEDRPPETYDEKEKRFWSDSYDYGLAKGITIPIRGVRNGFSMLCTSFFPEMDNSEDISHTLPTLQMMTPYIHEAVERVMNKTIPTPNLTNRELECLRWAVNGKTAWETAQILKVAERTAIFHLQNATKKLDATNKHHAISKAIALGLVAI